MSTFDKNKSHLSDLEKVNFENDTSLASPVSSIPGVGKATEHLKKQKIENIDDLLKSICNDFVKLVQITPSKGVNNHKILMQLNVIDRQNQNQWTITVRIPKF